MPSAALRAAARNPGMRQRLRARMVATSLLLAGTAALDAGVVDAGIETPAPGGAWLRRRGSGRAAPAC